MSTNQEFGVQIVSRDAAYEMLQRTGGAGRRFSQYEKLYEQALDLDQDKALTFILPTVPKVRAFQQTAKKRLGAGFKVRSAKQPSGEFLIVVHRNRVTS